MPLSQIVSRVSERNGEHIDRVLTVSAHHGLVEQESFFTKRVAAKNLTGYLVVRPGTFVYNKSYSAAAPFGVVTYNKSTKPGVVSPLYFTFRPNSDLVLEEYLEYVLNSNTFHQQMARYVKEGGRAHGGINVSVNDYLSVEVPLPTLLEQRRVVDLVSSVDSYIAALQQQADAARVARNAVLSELLSAGGEDWIETTLGDVAEWYSGGTPKAGRSEYYDGGDIPWVVIADLMKTEIYETATRITPAGLAEIGGRLAPVGSVLISMYATVGRSGITHVPVATNQAIAWSVPNTELVLPRFLLLIAQSLENEISSMGRGATQRNINRAMLREFTFQLPPIEEQGRIVEIVSSIDDLIESTEHAVADAKHLRSGLLLDLLSGSHEIPESYDRLLGAA
jgi:type I restriction enzyme S subunit